MRPPRFTVRQMLTVVAFCGLVSYELCWFYPLFRLIVFGHWTVYSNSYDERRFEKIQVGMTAEEVESLMGVPRSKEPIDGYETWMYTEQGNQTISFWRRWVIFDKGRVFRILNDYYDE
jgi:outer membrane protein assembly factor BamE (lipoprotein component of BamABCDE complex)